MNSLWLFINSWKQLRDDFFMSTEYHIRHVQVIDGKLVGVISIKDVVRAVGEQQSGELKRLNGYIKGGYC